MSTQTLPYIAPERVTVYKTAEDGTRYPIYQQVAPYAEHADSERIQRICGRCAGSGLYRAATWTGGCFDCGATGFKGTETLGEARRYWAKQIAVYNAEQDGPEQLALAKMLIAAGATL